MPLASCLWWPSITHSRELPEKSAILDYDIKCSRIARALLCI